MTTLLGILSGISLLFIAILSQGGVSIFFNLKSAMITLGGTFAAIFISFPFQRVSRSFSAMIQAFKPDIQQPSWVIGVMVRFAYKVRRESLFSLEPEYKKIDNRYVRRGMEMIIDGHPPETIRDLLETELDFMELRHSYGEMVFRSGAKFSPAFGLIGTLIGLVAMLKNLGDTGGVEELGAGMAVALITTFYGAMAANLFFAPVADKLKSRASDELLRARIIIEGVLMLQAGLNPRLIETKLNSYLPPDLRVQFYDQMLREIRAKKKESKFPPFNPEIS
ncbi:MAG: motility protein A [Nitrospinota bacterium]